MGRVEDHGRALDQQGSSGTNVLVAAGSFALVLLSTRAREPRRDKRPFGPSSASRLKIARRHLLADTHALKSEGQTQGAKAPPESAPESGS